MGHVCVYVCTYMYVCITYILSHGEKHEKDYFSFRVGVTSSREERDLIREKYIRKF